MAYLLGGLLFLVACVVQAGVILRSIADAMAPNGPQLKDLSVSLVSLFALALTAVSFLNFEPGFSIRDDGITLDCYVFFRKFIPWERVVGVKSSLLPFPGVLRVCFRGRSPTHVLLGLVFGVSLTPCFLVMPTVEGYDEALRHIRENATGDSNMDHG
jgi:hypothetical protein